MADAVENNTNESSETRGTSINPESTQDHENSEFNEMVDTKETLAQQLQSIYTDPWHNVCTCPPYNPEPKIIEPGRFAERKKSVLQNVYKTEAYLKEHRIDALLHYLFIKLLSDMPDNPVTYLENVLEECMLFRAGHGNPPVIFQNGHLQAVIKSFDPGQCGWLKPDQIEQIFITVGLTLKTDIIDKMSVEDVLQMIEQRQIEELCILLTAGTL